MTTRDLDFEEYAKTLQSLENQREEIARLEGFEKPTKGQEERLSTLQGSVRRLDEARKNHERQCLEAGVSFDGLNELYRTPGHTPEKELDGE